MKYKEYKIIYADPPWKYDDGGCNGGTSDKYPTMTCEELCNIPISDLLAADDCVLFIWGTYPKLIEVLKVIEAWGFKYKSIAFQWIKLNRSGKGNFYGLGRWTRGNTECCLLATKGKPKRISNSVSQLVFSPLREHSRKPDIIRDKIIKLMGYVPRVELFARQRFEGWDVWGNEVPKDIQRILK